LLIKKDGTREEFSREKLLGGIRVACAKRPISAADIERMAGEIEAELQRMGQEEVKSRIVGDMVIRKLRLPAAGRPDLHPRRDRPPVD